jgi:ribosomal protein L24
MMANIFKLGDLVKIHDPQDKGRQVGIIIDINLKKVHMVSHGIVNVVKVYWPLIDEVDWEYSFFLIQIEEESTEEE